MGTTRPLGPRQPKEALRNANARLTTSRAAVIDALTGSTDTSQGAYFWEGTNLLSNPANYFASRMAQNPPVFETTTVLGGTTFMRYNPDNPNYANQNWP